MAKEYGILRRYASALSVLMRLLDVSACVGAAVVAFVLRFGLNDSVPYQTYSVVVLVAALLVLVVFPVSGLYRSWRAQYLLAPVLRALLAWVITFAALLIFLVAIKEAEQVSRGWMAIWFGVQAGFLVLVRLGIHAGLAQTRRHGFNRRQVVIVGSGSQAQLLIRKAHEWVGSGFVVAAMFNGDEGSAAIEDVTVWALDELGRYVGTHPVDEVWITLALEQGAKLREVLTQLRDCTANIRYAPDLQDLYLLNRGITDILDTPMVDLMASPMQGANRLLKALEDRLLAAAILTLISPVLVLIAVGVKLSSAGPVLYRQERVGWNGRTFQMLKFRSMRADAESRTGAVWANRQDERTTRFGTFIRRTSLDELPQFINVLWGEMSIVGPRPERPVFVNQFKVDVPLYMQKHVVKAGITGWAQVNGWRGRTDLNERIQHDLYYIENWSVGFDLKIIFLTLFKGFINKNAY